MVVSIFGQKWESAENQRWLYTPQPPTWMQINWQEDKSMFSSLSFIVTLKKIRAFAINQYIFNNLIKIVIQQKNIVATLVHVKLECNKCVWKVPVRSKGSKRCAIIVLFS